MADRITLGGESFELHPSGPRGWSPEEANAFFRRLAEAVNTGELLTLAGAASPAVGASLIRSSGARLEISENGNRWRRVVGADDVRDIREYMTAAEETDGEATGAIASIFAEINGVPGVSGAIDAKVFIPGMGDLLTVEETQIYFGGLGNALAIIGEHGLSRGGVKNSGFKWVGAEGGTMFDLRGINGSRIEDLMFHGGGKAKYLVRAREATDNPGGSSATLLTASSGLNVRRCFFCEPTLLDDQNALFAAGNDNSADGVTLQASEYSFFECYFQGSGSGATGWGFRALAAGNTKNFVFDHCRFTQLYRGLESRSGYTYCSEINGGVIGRGGRPGAAMIRAEGNVLIAVGCGLENGGDDQPGTAARYISSGLGTCVLVDGGYAAAVAPADDFIISTYGPTSIKAFSFESNGRDSGSMLPWLATTAYIVGEERYNGDKAYRVVTAGTSAGAGGPTGTGQTIADGTAVWCYANPVASDILKIQQNDPRANGGWGGISVDSCSFGTNLTEPDFVPIYDGSENILTDGTGYAGYTPHRVYARGNVCGIAGGNIDHQMQDCQGDFSRVVGGSMLFPPSGTGITVLANAEQRALTYSVKLDYRAFQIAALVKDLVIARPGPRISIVRGHAEVKDAFTGTAGTLLFNVGVGLVAGTAEIFSALDAETEAVTPSTLIPEGIIPGWADIDSSFVNLRLTSSSGNLSGLSAGEVVFHFDYVAYPAS